MQKQRASWKAEEFWMRRKGHSPDRFHISKKMPGTGESQDPRSLHRASSEQVRPLDRQANLLDGDVFVAPKLEKTNGATSDQGGPRSNHKDKVHKKGQHGLLKTLVNFLTRTGSEEQKEKGEKKSKEKCNSPQDPKHQEAFVDPLEPTFREKDKERGDKKLKEKCNSPQDSKHLEAFVDPPEPTSKKKDKERGDKKSKEKCNSPQDSKHLEAFVDPPEPTSKKKDKERGDKKSKEKCNSPQDSKHLEAFVDPPEPTSKKKDKERGDKKSKEKCNSPQDSKHLEAFVDPPEPTSKKKDKERGDKKSKEKCNSPQDSKHLEAFVDPPEPTSKKKDKEKGDKKSKEKYIFPQGPEPLEALAEPPEPTSKKKDKKSNLKKAFSFKKHGNEEAKKSSGLDSRSSEAPRRPAKPTFLPLCISHRPASLATPDSDDEEVHERLFTEVRTPESTELSSQVGPPPPKEEPPLKRGSESNDIIIQKIVALLKEQGDKYNEKIKEDPNFRAAWDSLSFTSIQTLADVLGNQEENQKEPERSQVERCYCLTSKFAGNTNHAVHRIMGWRDHSVAHTFGHIHCNNEQYRASTSFLSPD